MKALLRGSRVVISGLKTRVTITITHIKGPITPLITSHETPSTVALKKQPRLAKQMAGSSGRVSGLRASLFRV